MQTVDAESTPREGTKNHPMPAIRFGRAICAAGGQVRLLRVRVGVEGARREGLGLCMEDREALGLWEVDDTRLPVLVS